jgi:hypothetical protein
MRHPNAYPIASFVLLLSACGMVTLPALPDARPIDTGPDARDEPRVDAGVAGDAAVDAAPGVPGDAGPCTPVSYDFTSDGASGARFPLFSAELTSSELLTWSDFGFGATPGTMALDPGETLVIQFASEDVQDITITWSEPGVASLAFERWDGIPTASRQPAEPSISLVGPVRVIRITALPDATALYLTGLSYSACP